MASAEKPRFPVLAGWIAGSLEIVVTYPLEFVKTQLQLQVTSSARAGPRALTMHRVVTPDTECCPLRHWALSAEHCLLATQVASSALYSAQTRYHGTFDCIIRTVRHASPRPPSPRAAPVPCRPHLEGIRAMAPSPHSSMSHSPHGGPHGRTAPR